MTIRRIIKQALPTSVFQAVEPYGHLVEAVTLNALHGFPGRGMNVIGVTGTNGKTSTAFFIHRMLTHAGYRTGIMTTVSYGVNDDIRQQMHHYTNVPVPELMRRLKWMRAQKIDWLVLEVTSQALAQYRVWGVPFSVGVLTNITHEHLDYHKTFERYSEAKRLLFKHVAHNTHGLQIGIANADDPQGERFAYTTPHPVLYGMHRGDVLAEDIKRTPTGSQYTAVAGSDRYDIVCHVPGEFYVQNSLAAICVGRALGLDRKQIEQGIAALEGVAGRMTTVDAGQDFDVIVDYAHTPDSFEKLFKDLRPVVKGKMIVMFGSAGRRDEAKRAVQGRLAGEYADEVILTEEDDRDIDGMDILNQIAGGAEAAGKVRNKDLFLVHDRKEAIRFTLQRARKGDVVLLLGKGHEKTIERADGEHPWNEIALANRLLKQR